MRTFSIVAISIMLGIIIGTCVSAIAGSTAPPTTSHETWKPTYEYDNERQMGAIHVYEQPECANGAFIRIDASSGNLFELLCSGKSFRVSPGLIDKWMIVTPPTPSH